MDFYSIRLKNHSNSNDTKLLFIDNIDDAQVIEEYLTYNYLVAHKKNILEPLNLDKDTVEYLIGKYGNLNEYYVASKHHHVFQEKIPRKAICESCGYECNTLYCGNCGTKM